MNGMQENYHVLEMWVLCTMAMNPPATWAGLKLISKKPMVRFKDNIRIMVDFHCLTLQYLGHCWSNDNCLMGTCTEGSP